MDNDELPSKKTHRSEGEALNLVHGYFSKITRSLDLECE